MLARARSYLSALGGAARSARMSQEHSGPPSHSQSVPSRQQSATEERDYVMLHAESMSSYEGSQLMSIAESSANEQMESEDIGPLNNEAQSEHGTIRDTPEEFDTSQHDQEQSFTTAPESLGLSAELMGFTITSAETPLGKGKGREKDLPPHMEDPDDEWERLDEALNKCNTITKDGQTQAINNRQELEGLRMKVTNSYNCTTYAINTIPQVRSLVRRLRAKAGSLPPGQRGGMTNSPHALANKALFADHGSNEESIDYERCLNAQARFEEPQSSWQARTEIYKQTDSSDTHRQITSKEQYAISMV